MIEDLYKIFEEARERVRERGVRLIDDAIAIRRIQSISVERWKTEYFSLLLSEDPLVYLYTTGKIYVSFCGEDLLLDLEDEAVKEIHSILEGVVRCLNSEGQTFTSKNSPENTGWL